MLHKLWRQAAAAGAAPLQAPPSLPALALAAAALLAVPMLASPAAAAAGDAADVDAGGSSGVTLETIMADPDWIGNAPEQGYWSADGRSVYYLIKRQGSELRDLYRRSLAERSAHLVPDAEMGTVDGPEGAWSRDRRWRAYVHAGDVFVKDMTTGAVRQLTRTPEPKSRVRFMTGDHAVSFREGNRFFAYDLASGRIEVAADVRLAKDPAAEEPADFLRSENLRLFDTVRHDREEKKARRERDQALQKADPTRGGLPWYLGDKVKIADSFLAPDGNWLLLVTRPKDAKDGKIAVIPHWVNEEGYVEAKDDRPLVGTDDGSGDSLVLLDLRYHQRHDLDLGALPGIKDDPLKAMRDAAAARAKAQRAAAAAGAGSGGDAEPGVDTPAARRGDRQRDHDGAKDRDKDGDKGDGKGVDKTVSPAVRAVTVVDAVWSDDGRHAAVEVQANDNKDMWIATLDFDGARLVPRHRDTDSAWINWANHDIGWLADNETLYFDSEEVTGHNHLFAMAARDGSVRQLTSGNFEIESPVPSFDGRALYYTANASHPGQHDVWRVDVASGHAEQLSHLGGLTAFQLSPDEKKLLLTHSSIAHHDELYVQDARAGADARRITDTVSPAFLAQHWTMPEILPIPSSHGAGNIYARVYTPPAGAPGTDGHRPAVVFVHGAGYLQDAHYGWSYYFHEFMFHSFLTQRGYVVIDMDYRASAGYGRDWRTAIYRQMGHPELEDLADGIDWLARNKGVDRTRVGVYGGSYGGFLTLMALFRTPDLFAAGAALRPVTDWADYNDTYSGAILNTPTLDPEAYERSSPIEFAAGLTKPLLICHGMVDDNVFFQDSVRLVERLIELKKENFEIAPFPVESHGFIRATSWLDEYRRIYKLMDTNLRQRQ